MCESMLLPGLVAGHSLAWVSAVKLEHLSHKQKDIRQQAIAQIRSLSYRSLITPMPGDIFKSN